MPRRLVMHRIGRRLASLLDAPAGSVEAHRTTYEALVELVVAGGTSIEDRLFVTQLAADYAWLSHTGRFADERIESELRELSGGLMAWRRTPAAGQVLHVLTEGYATGGHTRLAWRWIHEDRERVHSVVLTRQSRRDAPTELLRAVYRSGGQVRDLSRLGGGLRARAAALRALASAYEFAVLHVQPYDVVPLLAFAAPGYRPGVLFVNHADHVFWLGVSISDAVVCVRGSGARLAAARRGIDPASIVIAPIPVPSPGPAGSRDATRSRLGVGSGDVLVTTVAAGYKLAPMGELDYPAAALAIIAAAPRAVVQVIGPTPSGPWIDAIAQARGRLIVRGPTQDVADALQATDLYLDSFPFASITSLLEAGRAGLPLVTLRGHPAAAEVLSADGPGLDGVLLATSTPAETVRRVVALIEDASLRRAVGEETARVLAATLEGPPWRQAISAAYHAARPGERNHAATTGGPDVLDDRLVALHRGLDGLWRPLSGQLSLATPATRIEIALATLRAGRRVGARELLPDRFRRRLGSVR